MTKQQIINELKNGTSPEVQAAFDDADKFNSFCFRFKKSREYWNAINWHEVALAVKVRLPKSPQTGD